MPLLEICCYSLACAVTAQEAGADRIELCSAVNEGGLTPSAGVLKGARAQLTLPVHPIVRPRGGDFCYRADEFATMLDDIAFIRELGFAGLVTGVLNEDGEVDIARMRKIMRAADGMAVTFHRAFDMCASPLKALEELTDLGVARILTSGQQATAEKGISLITELKRQSRAPIIMAGAGVRLSNLDLFLAQGIDELHSSAGIHIASPMRYRNTGVSMSSDASADEYARYQVDGNAVAAMKAAMLSAQ
ncbi:copper homeostasis protein CutC [Cronobacter dublinensis]|uniref:copper homeostasis protein CutC n=1 Tax=Cronobacter dublinensis TaxID=413497 RepID=UPI000D00861C|nr:copper homeostasis protein CutC [Cronobacter dublinensis]EKK4080574.1 copper homeostasis protein CutC [Cronobacter dublinensis]ELY2796266.1 copper homeostasis protein CutC [Cronobacter dublinensis]ELY3771291.1 copper homeostasis protein CutC [Cronobacter dublinensis]ELY3971138.1 copper homeostasis protein CutC [Cronobacter dublinensis]ELY4485779.1 copper homeostasis protein CutC [Cronobacter dublinensis]